MIKHILSMSLLASVWSLGAAADEPTFSPEDVTFYEKTVKPILDTNCLKCHGGEKTKADLRVTSRGAILRGGDTGPAVKLDNIADSLMIKMINYIDDDHQMPPKQKLSAADIAVLTKWIEKGLPWTPGVIDEHANVVKKPLINDESRNYWAYKKPITSAQPQVSNNKWVRNPIDAYVLANLDKHGLKRAPPATKETLIRRVYYDLIGLPPTAEAVAAFATNKNPNAYEQLLDELLASPHYGEKWGRHWLDVVGYAETNGYERDGDKPHVWRYRDYVVKAFNDDKPYDQFIVEQLAGDEIEKPTAESITATGYYHLGIWDDEPADRELAHYDNLDRIVSTTSGAMMGMALGCARCHDHKRDPIGQADYYRMLGFFHNIHQISKNGANIIQKLTASADELAAWSTRVATLEKEVTSFEQAFLEKIPEQDREIATRSAGFKNVQYTQYKGHFDKLPNFSKLTVEKKGSFADGIIDPDIAGRDSDYAFVFEGVLDVPDSGTYTFSLDSDDGSRLIINKKVIIEKDGIHGMEGYKNATINLKKGQVRLTLEYFQAVGGKGLAMTWSGPGIGTVALVKGSDIKAGSAITLASQIAEKGPALLGSQQTAAYLKNRRELQHLRGNKPGSFMALSVKDQDKINDTYVLARGNPNAKTTKVEPGFPEVLGFEDPKLSSTPAGRRLALAQWLINADNPLTARVMANRLWQHHFGRGIVGSSNDFGQLGEQPTNQPLLDWLALEFIKRKWSIKEMHRLIMTSNTYLMSSQDDPTALAKDAGNLHQWRFNMRRLTAEEIRDSILTVDGSINLAMGGPSVFAPVPQAVLATASRPDHAWGKSSPDNEVRRSIYIKVKRSLVHPMLAMHDVADTDQSCPVRFATTVPTQALTMLNSDFMQERAQAFAKRLATESPSSLDNQIALGLRLVTQREPQNIEITRSKAFVKDLQNTEGLSEQESLTLFCLMVLNLNEFVYLN